MKTLCLFIFLTFLVKPVVSQPIPYDSLYLAQPRPGDSAVVFAQGLISLPGRNEVCITFSPDGKTIFYSIEFFPSPGVPFIMRTEYKNNKWSKPDTASFSKTRMSNEPFFSLNGSRLYMSAKQVENQVGQVDLSYVQKNDTLWSNPISLGSPPNTTADQYHPCIVSDTSIYFSTSSGLIARCQYHNGVYLPQVILPYPINYANTTQTWGDPYVSPNESYLIFKSTRAGGFGGIDLYISYKKTNGAWTNPKNLGSKINTQYDETSGDVTHDGLYMTFGSNKDLKWVSTGFIELLKHTNFVPYLKTQIPNQSDTVGKLYNYIFPDSTFIDDDGNNTLRYSARLSDGNPLPSWLSFDSLSRKFSGTPLETGSLSIRVTATDTANANAFCTFPLNILQNVSVNPINESVNDFMLYQNYPNPFNPNTVISYSLLNNCHVVLKLYDLLGKEIATLVNSFQKQGTHDIRLNLSNLNLSSGTYIYSISVTDNRMRNIFKENKLMSFIK